MSFWRPPPPPHSPVTPPAPASVDFFSFTLWNCQSSQWPGQALSFFLFFKQQGFKTVPTEQHGRRVWKRHNELEKKKNSLPGKQKPEAAEKMCQKGGETEWPSFLSVPSPLSEWQVFWSWEKWQKKETERKWEPLGNGEKSGKGEGWRENNLNRCHQLRHVE